METKTKRNESARWTRARTQLYDAYQALTRAQRAMNGVSASRYIRITKAQAVVGALLLDTLQEGGAQ